MRPSSDSHLYRPEIDGLRALAVLAVIVNHYDDTFLPSGHLGVDIFFVISGYVITTTLLNRRSVDSTLGDFLLDFYSRRIKRLLPALLLCVIVSGALTLLLYPVPSISLNTGAAALFGLSNVRLFVKGLDYFGPLAESDVFLHTWSLGVEEQFYLLYPALLWWTLRRPTSAQTLVGAIAVLSLLSAIAFVIIYQRNTLAAHYLLPFRFWELGAGCLIAALGVSTQSSRLLSRTPPLIVVGALVALLFAPESFAVPATLAVVVLTCIVVASLRPNTFTYRCFAHPSTVYIGLISYSLYLWHWPILLFCSFLPGEPPNWLPLAQLGLTLAISAASYRFVERPLRHATWSNKPLMTIGYGTAAALSSAVLLIGIARTPARHSTEVARLHGARFLTAQEPDSGASWNDSRIKQFTGQDRVTARFMRKDDFSFVPQFKLWFAANEKPKIRKVDYAIERRLRLIPFTVTIPRPEVDLRLRDKLKAEWPGILRWAVDGCLEWQKRGLNPPAIVTDATLEYIVDEDVIGQFIDDRCELGLDYSATSDELFQAWMAWAQSNGEYVGTKRLLTNKLAGRRDLKDDKHLGPNRTKRGFLGIRVVPAVGGPPL